MENMFYKATSFDQPIDFNSAKVTTMKRMFAEATSLNKPIKLDAASVTDVESMFESASSFVWTRDLKFSKKLEGVNQGYVQTLSKMVNYLLQSEEGRKIETRCTRT